MATISFVMSVCLSLCPSAWNISAPTGRIFIKFYIWELFRHLSRKFKFHSNLTRVTGTLHEDRYKLMIKSSWILHTERNISPRSCRENRNTHFMFNNFPKNVALHEIMWKYMV
jgi:hypothetical protein